LSSSAEKLLAGNTVPNLYKTSLPDSLPSVNTQQRNKTENSKQIFPEKELRGLCPNFPIHVSVSNLYVPTIDLPILPQENMCTDPGNI
jgi:hypothetical protein